MSTFDQFITTTHCLQCLAEEILAAEPAELEKLIASGFTLFPMARMELPDADDMETARVTGRRAGRLLSRLALLEPHECGKLTPVDQRSQISRGLAERGPFDDGVSDVVCATCPDGRTRALIAGGSFYNPVNHHPACIWRRARELHPAVTPAIVPNQPPIS